MGHAHCLVTKRGWGHHHHHQHHHHPVITIIIIITIITVITIIIIMTIIISIITIIIVITIITIIPIIITVSGRARPSSSSNYPLFLTGPLQEILNFNLTVLKKADAEPKKG